MHIWNVSQRTTNRRILWQTRSMYLIIRLIKFLKEKKGSQPKWSYSLLTHTMTSNELARMSYWCFMLSYGWRHMKNKYKSLYQSVKLSCQIIILMLSNYFFLEKNPRTVKLLDKYLWTLLMWSNEKKWCDSSTDKKEQNIHKWKKRVTLSIFTPSFDLLSITSTCMTHSTFANTVHQWNSFISQKFNDKHCLNQVH